MSEVVVDASAVLAVLNQENGSREISQLISNAAISSVNLSEIVAKLADVGIPENDIRQILLGLNLQVIFFDEEQAIKAGMLRSVTKSIGLSLGDRACLALGISLSQTVLTTDQIWGQLDLEIEIKVLR